MDIEQSIATCFEAQVLQHGSRLAIKDGDFSLNFVELNRLANGIALKINAHTGDSPGAVAILMEHGALLPVAVIAILKANGFYLQLDMANPAELNTFLLTDSEATVLLTDRHNQAAALSLAAQTDVQICVVGTDEPGLESEYAPPLSATGHDLCCLVYTSGSTGRPKGVQQLHRNVLHQILNYTAMAKLDHHDRFSLLQSVNVIAGTTALFGALLNGAALFPFRVQNSGLERMANWLQDERLTCLHTVPTLFRRFAAFALKGDYRFDNLRLLRLGGEAATQSDLRHCLGLFGENSQLLTGLSSAEALDIRMRLFTQITDHYPHSLPLGNCVPGKEVELVDEYGANLDSTDVGMFQVRSEFLFKGYWNREELTSRVLADDPQDKVKSVYQTGDLGRRDAVGNLFHVGRVDTQVKVAGHRLNLVQIEDAIRQVPYVIDAAVQVHSQGDGPVSIQAFIMRGRKKEPSLPAVRSHLLKTLPAYSLPSSIAFVADLPLLAGGKIDRQALKMWADGNRPTLVEPRGPVEQTLHVIWKKVLAHADIGVHDDFFQHLGGDSLAVAETLTEVSELFQVKLPLSVLFEAPTIADLARRLVQSEWQIPEQGMLVINPDGERTPLFAICGVYGHALRLLLIGHALDSEQPFYGLQPPAMDWHSANCQTIEQMARHYCSQITGLHPQGPYRLMGTSFGGVMAFEVAIQLQQSGHEVELLCMIDSMPPNRPWINRIKRLGFSNTLANTPVTDDIAGMGVRVAKAHGKALQKYSLKDTFKGVIQYFLCTQVTASSKQDRRLVWGQHATGGQHLMPVPGNHGTFHQDPQFSAVVAGIRELIN